MVPLNMSRYSSLYRWLERVSGNRGFRPQCQCATVGATAQKMQWMQWMQIFSAYQCIRRRSLAFTLSLWNWRTLDVFHEHLRTRCKMNIRNTHWISHTFYHTRVFHMIWDLFIIEHLKYSNILQYIERMDVLHNITNLQLFIQLHVVSKIQ